MSYSTINNMKGFSGLFDKIRTTENETIYVTTQKLARKDKELICSETKNYGNLVDFWTTYLPMRMACSEENKTSCSIQKITKKLSELFDETYIKENETGFFKTQESG